MEIRTTQKDYLEWLSSSLLEPKLIAEPELSSSITEGIVNRILPLAQGLDKKSKKEVLALKIIVNKLIIDLPENIKDPLIRNPEIARFIGFKTFDMLSLKDFSFRADEFWRAISEAVNNDASTLKTLDKKTVFECKRINHEKDGTATILFSSSDSEKGFEFSSPLIPIMSDDVSQRRGYLLNQRHWFDCGDKEFNKIIDDIALLNDPYHRTQEAESFHSSSIAVQYDNLYQSFRQGNSITKEKLTPSSGEMFLNYYRLKISDFQDQTSFNDAWGRATIQHLKEKRMINAIDSIFRLPILPPQNVWETLDNLSSTEREPIFSKLSKTAQSPVSVLNLIGFAVRYNRESDVYTKFLEDELRKIVAENLAANRFKSFRNIMTFIEYGINSSHSFLKLPAPARLFCIWSHTSKLYNILVTNGINITEFSASLVKSKDGISISLFNYNQAYERDILNPSNISEIDFNTQGLGEVIKSVKNVDISTLNLREHFESYRSKCMEDKNGEMLQLFKDPMLFQNSLDSFFRRDRSSSLDIFFTEDTLRMFSSESIKLEIAKQVNLISKLGDPSYPMAFVHAASNGKPICSDLSEQLLNDLSSVNFLRLFNKNPLGCIITLRVMIDQCESNQNEFFKKISQIIIKITSILGRREKKYHQSVGGKFTELLAANKTIQLNIIELAYKLSLKIEDKQESVRYFVDITEKILKHCPDLAKELKYGFWQMTKHLPTAISRHLWKLLLRARSA